ncbi:hypothetical protein WDV85_09600 [Pseudokineococcus sp. 5B2Z-1]|uniref:hypothetical protein n=1 Tax=Pseudokineococcus sp. 5B2Z-1 TaxID=3132744 RepID=UPI0030A35FA5
MEISAVDPRDVRWEADAHAYRVHFWDRPTDPDPMLTCEETRIVGAEDVSEVLGGAASRAGDRDVVVHLEVATSSQGPGPWLAHLHVRDRTPRHEHGCGAAPPPLRDRLRKTASVPTWSVIVLALLVVASAVASLVTLARHRTPHMGRATARKVARSLNRGEFPAAEEDRPAALAMARLRASSHWTVVMLVGLALLQVALAEGDLGLPRGIFYGIAVLLLVTAALTLAQLLRSRRALRSAGAPRP